MCRPRLRTALLTLIVRIIQAAIVVMPAVVFQKGAYDRFCGADGTAAAAGSNSSSVEREWCAARIPSIYSHVQRQHWDVGLFRYWKIKQIPQFVLAAPVLLLAAIAARRFVHWAQLRVERDAVDTAHWAQLRVESELRLAATSSTFVHIDAVSVFLFLKIV